MPLPDADDRKVNAINGDRAGDGHRAAGAGVSGDGGVVAIGRVSKVAVLSGF